MHMPNGEWYYAVDGHQRGPVPLATLQEMAGSGALRPQDMVWSAGMANWQPAGAMPVLFPGGVPVAQASSPGYPQSYPYPQQQMPLGYHAPESGVHFGGFWIRFGAAILDGLILLVPNLIVQFGTRAAFGLSLLDADQGPLGPELGASALIMATQIVIAWLYAALQESSSAQATLGKRACGLKVVDLQGQRISFARATGRHFAKLISYCTLMIGFMMAGWTQRKQAMHDMIASTYVIRSPR